MEAPQAKPQLFDFAGYAAEPSHAGEGSWFGPEERPLFGWYHAPEGALRPCGILLCPPFGHEYMVSFRAYRKLATALVKAGFAVLRFDYDGTGDAAGQNWDSGRLAAWQQSIASAARYLRQRSGLAHVALFGVRLGALLAASVARQLEADALVMLAPAASGRLYVRELMAFRSMNPAARKAADSQGPGEEEVVGYALSEETRSALGQLDYAKLEGPLAPAALVIARDDVPSSETRIVATLEQSGVRTELESIPGYGAMMPDDAYDSRIPDAIWSRIVDWLSTRYSERTSAPHSASPRRMVQFGNGATLLREELIDLDGIIGIITEPASQDLNRSRPALIISNTGANHHVGNHRLCVTMARTWAKLGYCVVRYDRPGIGDSAPTPGGKENAVYAAEGVASLRAVMDYLESSRGHKTFALAGLCSGGYFSFHTALADHRAVGLLMINPLTYAWRNNGYQPQKSRMIYKSTGFYVRAATSRETWQRLLRGEINVTGISAALLHRARKQTMNRYRLALARARRQAALTEIGEAFLSLITRGVEIMMIFDADEGGIELMHEHLQPHAELLRPYPNFRLEIIKNADHTFTPIWAQRQVSDIVGQHWRSRFG